MEGKLEGCQALARASLGTSRGGSHQANARMSCNSEGLCKLMMSCTLKGYKVGDEKRREVLTVTTEGLRSPTRASGQP